MLQEVQENTKCCLWRKKQFQFELAWRIFVQFSLEREAARSLDVFLPFFFFLFSSHRAHDIPSPSSGPLVFQFQAGRHLPRPSGICSAAQSALNLNIKRRVSGGRQPPFPSSCTSRFPLRTSVYGSLLLSFYFEVEFLHLCLT